MENKGMMGSVEIERKSISRETIIVKNNRFEVKIYKLNNNVNSVVLRSTYKLHVLNLNIEQKIIPILNDLANICIATISFLKQNEEQNSRWY